MEKARSYAEEPVYAGVLGFSFDSFMAEFRRAVAVHDWLDSDILNGTVYPGNPETHAENDRRFWENCQRLISPRYWDQTRPQWRMERRIAQAKLIQAMIAIRGWRIFGRMFMGRGR